MSKRANLKGIFLLILFFLVILLGLAIYFYTSFKLVDRQLPDIPVSNQITTQVLNEQEQQDITYEGLLTRNFSFEYNCQDYQISLHLFRSLYDYFSSKDKAVYYQENSTVDLEKDYYSQFLMSDVDDGIVDQIIKEIGGATNTITTDDLATAIISFVQNIDYDCEKLFSYENIEDHDYQTNFPYETLYQNQGVCGDSTILLAKILARLGYGTAFLIFEEENHMAFGLQCPEQHADYFQDGKGYCYVETTAPARIGILPQEISDSRTSNSHRVIKISDGATFNKMYSLADQMEADSNQYGDEILAFSTCEEIAGFKQIHEKGIQLAEIGENLDILKAEIEPMSSNLDYVIEEYNKMGCKGTVSKSKYKKCQTELNNVQSIQYTVEALVLDFNNLADEYNRIYDTYVEDIDYLENLIAKNSTTCSGLTFGGIPTDGPTISDK